VRIGELLKKWRILNERTLRDLGKEIGVSAATLMRIEQGHAVDSATMVALIDWLFKVPMK
jgi:transcriptional regulator with XRE-family HTH domain